MSELSDKARKHLRELAPHVATRKSALLIRDLADELDRLQNENECFVAMKEGIGIRIADLEAKIKRLELEKDAWRKACRYIYETAGEGGKNGRPIDCYDNRTWTKIVKLIGAAEAAGGDDENYYART